MSATLPRAPHAPDAGERPQPHAATAPFCPPIDFGSAPLLSVVGDPYAILVDGAQTGDEYAVIEMRVAPGNGPPPHTHTREHECFYIVSGELTFFTQGQSCVARAGALFHAPRGIEHTFRNTGTEPARALIYVTPAGLEGYFRAIGEPLSPGASAGVPVTEAHVRRLLDLAPQYGLQIRSPG